MYFFPLLSPCDAGATGEDLALLAVTWSSVLIILTRIGLIVLDGHSSLCIVISCHRGKTLGNGGENAQSAVEGPPRGEECESGREVTVIPPVGEIMGSPQISGALGDGVTHNADQRRLLASLQTSLWWLISTISLCYGRSTNGAGKKRHKQSVQCR